MNQTKSDPRVTQFYELVKNQPIVFKTDQIDYSSEEGKAFRAFKLTSSDVVPGLLGLGYHAPHKTWLKYNNELEEEEKSEFFEEILKHGKKREPEIFRTFKDDWLKTFPGLTKDDDFFESGCFVKKDTETGLTIYSTPDGHFWDGAKYCNIEIKARAPHMDHAPIEYIEEIKDPHLIQMICQMFCTGLMACWYIAATTTEAHVYRMTYNPILMEDILCLLEGYLSEAKEKKDKGAKIEDQWPKRLTKQRGQLRDQLRIRLRAQIKKIKVIRC